MLDFDDDELFDGLESDTEPKTDFDVSAIYRRVKKLEYKLEKQKEYKKNVEEKLKAGVAKTEEAIDNLKAMIVSYMIQNNKKKLSFDDLATISLLNLDKEDWILPTTKEDEKQLIEKLINNQYTSAIKTEYKLDKRDFKDVLERNPHLVKDLDLPVSWGKVDPSLRVTKK